MSHATHEGLTCAEVDSLRKESAEKKHAAEAERDAAIARADAAEREVAAHRIVREGMVYIPIESHLDLRAVVRELCNDLEVYMLGHWTEHAVGHRIAKARALLEES